MRINHNIAALNTYRQLGANGINSSKNLEKLSSGLRINRAGDDAAGLAISEKMRGQIRGLEQASRNAQDGISLIQTAEGALNETHSILQRMRELATQAANDTNTSEDRESIQEEINQLSSEINRIGNATEFNTRKILNGNVSLTGAARQLDGTETVSANLANLTVDSNAAAVAGDYKISITNEGGQTVQNIGNNVLTSSGVTSVTEYSGADDDVSLAEGNYKIVIDSTSAKTTSSVTDDGANPVLNTSGGNNPITIDANSTLANGNGYEVEVTKTTAINATNVNAGGISNVNADNATDASEGTYTITTSAAVTSADGSTDKDLIDNGVISNVTIAANSAYSDADTYTILVSQTDGDETDGSISFKFELQKGGVTVAGAEATTTVTASSGSTQIKIGDVTFDADLAKLWASDTTGDATAGSLDTGEVALTIGNKVTVTQNGTSDAQSVTITDGAAIATQTFTFLDGGILKLDVADDTGQFTRGNTYTTTVSYDDTYSVQMKETDGTTNRGSAVTLTEKDLANPSNLTNIQIGSAGDGVQIDLDAAKLSSLSSGTTSTATFNVGTSTEFTAQIQKADGSAVAGAGTYALTGTTNAESIDLGFNIGLNYDGTGALAAGETFFSVKDVTSADDYRMTLALDADSNGSFETTVVNKQAFNLGDSVTLGSIGVSIDTKAGTTIADNATFTIENGTTDKSLQLQIGANAGQSLSIAINDMRADALNVTGTSASGSITAKDGKVATLTAAKSVTDGTNNTVTEYALDVSTADKATASISVLNDAINAVSNARSKLGAFQNRLEHTINNLGTSSENLTAAESRIRDVDMAKEMMEFTKNNILSQAAQAMLAQANQQPQGVLQLLR